MAKESGVWIPRGSSGWDEWVRFPWADGCPRGIRHTTSATADRHAVSHAGRIPVVRVSSGVCKIIFDSEAIHLIFSNMTEDDIYD